MEPAGLRDRLRIAEQIAHEAGAIMRRHFDDDQQVVIKSDGSPVTVADRLINRLVIDRIGESFPGDGVLGEEESTAGYGTDGLWMCDPVDGTLAYTWGVPTAMFSLAYIANGVPAVGVAYDPFLDRLYHGQRGGPALCNGVPLQASASSLSDGVVAITSNVRRILAQDPIVASLARDDVSMTSFSGAAYKACLVARGRLAGYIETVVKPHDIAACQVIVEGAGGVVTDLLGRPLDFSAPFQGVIVANRTAHMDLVRHAASG